MPSPRSGTRFLVAVAASVALVASGPLLGQARGAIRAMFSAAGPYVWFLNALLAAIAAVVVGLAFLRARNRHTLVGGLLAAVLLAIAGRWLAAAPATASQGAVERFHFIEFGLVTWLFYRAVRATWPVDNGPALVIIPALLSLLVGIADEWFQWFVPERIGEWPDIFLNSNAILAGLIFSLGLDPPARLTLQWRPESRAVLLRVVAVVVVALAAFVHVVHLGSRVTSLQFGGGAFMSRFSAEQLRALSADRTERWKTSPPTTLRRYSREDQYLAEAAWHVQARNEAWTDDKPEIFWLENQILEDRFAPAIDIDSYVMPRSRWPPGQRADAERRFREMGLPVSPTVRLNDSHAHRLAIYLWSPWWLWGAALTIALFLMLFSLRRF